MLTRLRFSASGKLSRNASLFGFAAMLYLLGVLTAPTTSILAAQQSSPKKPTAKIIVKPGDYVVNAADFARVNKILKKNDPDDKQTFLTKDSKRIDKNSVIELFGRTPGMHIPVGISPAGIQNSQIGTSYTVRFDSATSAGHNFIIHYADPTHTFVLPLPPDQPLRDVSGEFSARISLTRLPRLALPANVPKLLEVQFRLIDGTPIDIPSDFPIPGIVVYPQ